MITTPEFLLTSLVVVLIPGTGVIYTVSNGLFVGWRASVAAACGCILGIVPHLLASILGLATIICACLCRSWSEAGDGRAIGDSCYA